MIDKLKQIFKKQQFLPTYLGLIINPFYIIRKGLYRGIKNNSEYINGKLLDFGCGHKPYESLFNVIEYVGLDIEKSGYPNQKSANVFYDGKKIPFNDNTFDSVLASEVFEHIFNPDEVLLELNRVLKKGGNILITVPFVWFEHEIPYDFARYSSFGIEHLLRKNGFQIVKTEKTTNYLESVIQLFIAYIFNIVFPKNIYIQYLLHFLITSPLLIILLLFSKLFPSSDKLYCNLVIVAKK